MTKKVTKHTASKQLLEYKAKQNFLMQQDLMKN